MAQEVEQKANSFEYEGVKIEVTQDVADDVEVIDMIDEIQNEQNVVRVMGLCKRILGKEKLAEIIAAYKKNHSTDRMPATELEGLMTKLFEGFDPKE